MRNPTQITLTSHRWVFSYFSDTFSLLPLHTISLQRGATKCACNLFKNLSFSPAPPPCPSCIWIEISGLWTINLICEIISRRANKARVKGRRAASQRRLGIGGKRKGKIWSKGVFFSGTDVNVKSSRKKPKIKETENWKLKTKKRSQWQGKVFFRAEANLHFWCCVAKLLTCCSANSGANASWPTLWALSNSCQVPLKILAHAPPC